MPALTARAVLDVWEQSQGLPPGGRALRLWSSLSGRSANDASDATLGDRDRALLAIHRSLFGQRIAGRADCPQCHEMLEVDVDLDMFDVPQALTTDRLLRMDGVVIEWRSPTARDLADLARPMNGTRGARVELLQRCVTAVRQGDRLLDFDDWPSEVASELGAVMASADPLMDPRIELACATCGHVWSICFDIATFLWCEIDDVARRLLSDVHCLASAYGWAESEILELTAARRAAYLQLCSR
jgi:hypothetical protein